MSRSAIDSLYIKALEFFEGDPARIQHFAKVHSFAVLIGREEGLSGEELLTLEAAAILHDMGIRPAEQKYGSSAGKLQEKEGPPIAEEMLRSLNFAPSVISRVSYLVGHHHTYTNIDGLDYQILVEADFLVNFYEGSTSKEQIEATGKSIFKTKTGRDILCTMFGVSV